MAHSKTVCNKPDLIDQLYRGCFKEQHSNPTLRAALESARIAAGAQARGV